MEKMYPAVVNSPKTELTELITDTQTEIIVTDASALLQGAGIAVIGNGDAAETITYSSVDGNTLKGCVRGFEGLARSWAAGTRVARNFTAYDHESFRRNIEGLADRMDGDSLQQVILSAGVQILEAVKAAPFSLTGLTGRTLINLIGRDGNCENVNKFSAWQATLVADSTNKSQGSQSLKITTSAGTSGTASTPGFPIKAGSYYIIIAEVKLGSGTSVGPYIGGLSSSKSSGNSTDKSKFTTVWKAYNAAPSAITAYAIVEVLGAVGSIGYIEAIRVYEINAADYKVLDSMTADQVAAKYPYVDSVTPVRNPYAIRYGENLLPSFYEWSAKEGSPILLDDKRVSVTSTDKFIHTVTVMPGQTYTVSANSSAATGRIVVNNSPESTTIAEITGAGVISVTFTVPAGLNAIVVRLLATTTTAITMSNPMLNIGSEAQPFVPREDAMFALQTDLYADPVTGANADSVFVQGGQYFKAKKWQRLVLDGSQNWIWSVSSYTGYKLVQPYLNGNYAVLNNPVNDSGWMVKYDGKLLTRAASGTITSAGDQQIVTGTYNSAIYNAFNLTVSNADSGWGDNYTPTADEIKAYFLGYKMGYIDGSGMFISPYNNTGTKAWKYVQNDPSQGTTNWSLVKAAVDSNTYTPGYTPYELVYQLATPTVEPIVSEGQLTFNEGSNQVEVGTGIVLRERANPIATTSNSYNINNWHTSAKLKYQTRKIVAVYKNSARDFWNIIRFSATNATYGDELASLPAANYDPSAAYSVTYLMLATSPIQPITGTYAGNEKSLLEDLVDSVTQQEIRLAVVENKKAEKDNPAWITPTLLNSWVLYDTNIPVGYYKDSNGIVRMRGFIKSGAVNSVIFRLPSGYRPKNSNMQFVAYSSDGSKQILGRIIVYSNGDVTTYEGNNWLFSLDSVSFLAEQ
ncbi:hypothetical protein [Paenibacillus medicaginis]|uniref:Uncharacterized protein n=1 Tax=Paenibacillus medicaginis TaxID=1470560 RepID=A0ABV5C1F5_9BACL